MGNNDDYLSVIYKEYISLSDKWYLFKKFTSEYLSCYTQWCPCVKFHSIMIWCALLASYEHKSNLVYFGGTLGSKVRISYMDVLYKSLKNTFIFQEVTFKHGNLLFERILCLCCIQLVKNIHWLSMDFQHICDRRWCMHFKSNSFPISRGTLS